MTMEILKTTVGHALLELLPDNIAFIIATFLAEDPEETRAALAYKEFIAVIYKITMKGKKIKFVRYCKNLRFDSFFVYSYDTEVVKLNWKDRTAQRLGKWSKTTSTHMNYAIRMLEMCYDFTEIK